MIYLIKGNEQYSVLKKLNELTKEAELEMNAHFHDGSLKTFSISNMLEDCMNISFFSDKNYVIVKNPIFLMKKVEDSKEIEHLLEYIKKPLYETDLIFYEEEMHFNGTLKLYKEIAKNAQVFDFDYLKPNDFEQLCLQEIKAAKLEISKDAALTLIRYCQNKMQNFYNYLEILKLYPGKIDLQCVERLFIRPLEENIFLMINAILTKDLTNAIGAYQDLKKQYTSIIPILSIFASQLRHLYHVAYLKEEGYRLNDIATTLNAKTFRIQKSLETLRNIDKKEILSILNELANLNLMEIQDDTLDGFLSFELFLIKITRSQYAIN